MATPCDPQFAVDMCNLQEKSSRRLNEMAKRISSERRIARSARVAGKDSEVKDHAMGVCA